MAKLFRRGWKYHFELMMPDGEHHTLKKVTLNEGFTWCSKVMHYFKIKDEEETIIRITKKRVIIAWDSKLITLRDRKEQQR